MDLSLEGVTPADVLTYLSLARALSRESTCEKMRFGCLITDLELRVLGAGFNHSVRPDGCCLRRGVPSGTQLERCFAVHAEQAALLDMLGKAGDRELAKVAFVAGLYPDGKPYESTGFSCTFCVRLLREAGVVLVVIPDSSLPVGFRLQSVESAITTAYEVARGQREAYSR